MSIVLPALAVAFAAFCVWLGVRYLSRRERWAKWTLTTVVGPPVLYVASFGPACWVAARQYPLDRTTGKIYRPLVETYPKWPGLLHWYVWAGLPQGAEFSPVGDWLFYFPDEH